MAVIQKTLFAENLDRYNTFVTDTDSNSKYFKITELPDTFTGGKNAFLIQGSQYLVADTLIKIELKDASGNIIYHEPGEGIVSSSLSGEEYISEYYEGVSKVVAVYIYPETAYGPCTLTILGELSEYDNNGLIAPIPLNWQGQYNVKWQKQINVNPSLANTTKIRFYKRPTATIKELVSPIYTIDSNTGNKITSGINQSFADIKLSQMETFAGDVKRIKVFRTSLGDISDYDMVQDILVESKEELTSYNLSGSVVGNTGLFTSEVLEKAWEYQPENIQISLNSTRIDNGIKIKPLQNTPTYFYYSSSLNLSAKSVYEFGLDAFYSASIDNKDLNIYISGSNNGEVLIGTLNGTSPTKNLKDQVIPFSLTKTEPSASLYLEFPSGAYEWHVGNVSLKLSQDTAFSPDSVSFITSMPMVVGNQDYNFKFEFYDINNNYVPVAVTQSANFTGGSNTITKLLTFESDRTAFRFSTGSFANPPNQNVRFKTIKTNFTGSVTYASSAFDVGGTYIEPTSYAGTYPGWFTSQNDNGALLSIASFSGSVSSVLVGSIVYTASCEGFTEFETIYRFEDGDNAPGVFVTANTNQFIYKATDLSLNPTGQVITIEAKRKNLASATTPLIVNSGSGKPPLTLVSTNSTNGVDTYTLAGSSYSYGVGETIYYISGSDQFGNEFSDSIKISPVKILDGLSATLTNDNASLPALSNGFVASGSFVLTSGSVTVKVGNESISFDDDNDSVRANNTFAITNISGTGCTPNTGNNSNPTTNTYGITNLTADSGSLNITINYKDGAGDTTDIVKTVTYTKNKKAAPVLRLEATPKDQSVSAKSTGEQVDSFSNVTISVKETYDGATNALTITSLTATSSDISSISTTAASGLVSLSSKTLGNSTNATTIAISAVVTDSEGVSRTLTDTLSLSKVKKATPNVEGQISPNAQTVTANSDGTNAATPTSLTVKALEGGTTRLTSVSAVGVGVTIGSISYDGSSPYNYATIPLSSVSSDTATVTVTINYTDSEGNTGSKTAIATISKAKKASPVVVIAANPQSQTVAATAAGVYSSPATIAVSVNEGGTAYSYGSGNSTFTITGVTNGTNSNGTITPTTPSSAAGVSGVITLSYTNSEGTTVTGKTINFSVGVAVQGSNGADGGAGPGVVYRGEWANGTIYYKTSARVDVVSYLGSYYLVTTTHTSATGNGTTGQPGVGTYWTSFGAQFTSVATDMLLAQDSTITRGLVMGTLGSYSGFIRSANASSLTSGKGFYLDVDGKVRFGDPSAGYIYFDGTDVNIAGAVKIGAAATINGVASSTVQAGAASGATAQQNNSAKTDGSVGGWTIANNAIYSGTNQQTDGYQTSGVTFASNGAIHSKNFYVNTDGTAGFKGTLTVGGTDLTTTNTLNENTTKSQVGLGSVSNLGPQAQAETGINAGTTITGGGITLSSGGSIKGGQTDYNTGTGFFLGYTGSKYKFSIGNASSKGITWDGDTLSIGGDVNIGANLASSLTTSNALTSGLSGKISTGAAASDVNDNTTNISGNKIRTGAIASNNHSGTADGSGFSTAGMSINLTGGGVSAKNFRITAGGDAFFQGNVTAYSGYIGNGTSGWTINSTNLASTNGQTVLNSNGIIQLKNSGGTEKVKMTYDSITPSTYSNSLVTYGDIQSDSPTTVSAGSNQYFLSATDQYTGASLISPAFVAPAAGTPTFVFSYPNHYWYAGYGTTNLMGYITNNTNKTVQARTEVVFEFKLYASDASTQLGSTQYRNIFSRTYSVPGGTTSFPGYEAGAVSVQFTDASVSAGQTVYVRTSISMQVNGYAIYNGSYPTGNIVASTYSPPALQFTSVDMIAINELLQIGINGISVGSSDGQYAAIGTVAGSPYVGKFQGSVIISGTTVANLSSSSDRRLKYNIIPITNSINKIKSLNPVDFHWNKSLNEYENRERGYGFIAQDVEEVFPELIHTSQIGVLDDAKSLDYTSLHGIEVAAIKELITKMELMENKILELENKISGSI